ncbi:hypothetical protein ACFL2M_01420 [Patescibacteria group bacterium]
MPERPERKKPEKREANWSQAAVLHIATPEQHSTPKREKQYSPFVHKKIIPAIKKIITDPEIDLGDTQRRQLKEFFQMLQAYQKWIERPTEHQTEAFTDYVRSKQPSAELKEVSLSGDQETTTKVPTLREGVAVVQTELAKLDRPEVISTSDNHITTGVLFKAMEANGWDLQNTAVLVFDHHADLTRQELKRLYKSNVISFLLNENLVSSAAIFGVRESDILMWGENDKPVDLVSGPSLYQYETPGSGKPSREEFIAQLRKIFEKWRQRGIQQVFTSVDLDALRLSEQLYSATDYNPLDPVRELVQRFDLGEFADVVTDKTAAPWDRAYAEKCLAEIIIGDIHRKEAVPYRGIPASWVVQAVEMAQKEYDLQIGIRNPKTKQIMVGDVVEYVPPDHRMQTAKIASGIMNGLLHAAQQQPKAAPEPIKSS